MTDDQSPDDDDRLARLYRETDDDAEPPGEWSSLRAMIGAARADGFDEEPPARIDALLMAAARQHAPAPRPRWWQRLAAWMKPVMLHPATAGALALVVVVGVAGVMYRRGDREVAQPPAPTIAPPVDQRSVTTAPPAVVTPPPEESERGAAVAPVAVAPPPPAPTPIAPRPSEPPAGPSPKRPPPANKPAATAGAGGGPTTMTTGALDEAAEADQLGVEGPAPDDGVAQVPPPPPPPPVALPDRQATTAGDKGATVADLLRLARSAAAARDCEKVRVLSAQVLARDPAYHKAVFARDAAIAACLPAQLGY
jgi:hypothetical protein